MFMDLTREVKAYCGLASQPCRRLAQKPRPTCAAKAPIGLFRQPVWLSLRTGGGKNNGLLKQTNSCFQSAVSYTENAITVDVMECNGMAVISKAYDRFCIASRYAPISALARKSESIFGLR
jgi:hypothetical protein